MPTADFDYESTQHEASIGKPVLVPVSRQLSPNEKEDSYSSPDVLALKSSNFKKGSRNEVDDDGDSNDLEPMVSASSYRGDPVPTDEQANSVKLIN